MLEWAGKVSKKYVNREMSEEIHASAEPFIKWLKEAEEEESDSEEEDSDDDLEVSALLLSLTSLSETVFFLVRGGLFEDHTRLRSRALHVSHACLILKNKSFALSRITRKRSFEELSSEFRCVP